MKMAENVTYEAQLETVVGYHWQVHDGFTGICEVSPPTFIRKLGVDGLYPHRWISLYSGKR